jgi:hypothetical protein
VHITEKNMYQLIVDVYDKISQMVILTVDAVAIAAAAALAA